MAFQKKCPLCSSKMSKVNGVLTCPDCGYNESFSHSSYTTSSSGETTSTAANTSASSRSFYQNSAQNAGQQNAQSTLRPYEQYLNQQQASSPSSGQSFAEITAQRRAAYENNKSNSFARNILICIVLILICIGIFVPIALRFFTSSPHEDSTYASKTDNESTTRAGSGHYSADTDGSDKELPIEMAALTVPQSEFFEQMMSLIFDKEIDDISATDSEQIISLHVYEVSYDYMAVDYALADGTQGTVYPASQKPDVSKDLTCFVNLEELYLEIPHITI